MLMLIICRAIQGIGAASVSDDDDIIHGKDCSYIFGFIDFLNGKSQIILVME